MDVIVRKLHHCNDLNVSIEIRRGTCIAPRATRVIRGGSGPGMPGGAAVGEFAMPAPPGSVRQGEVQMKLQPLGDRVVVEREAAAAVTAGGIVLPDTAKDRPQQGTVVAVGDGRTAKDGKKRPLQVKAGDKVLFTSYAGEETKLDGDKKVLLMREDDILAVIE
jgi:chaperonin GroES